MTDVTFKGEPLALKGSLPVTGSKAPAFELVDRDLQRVTLESLGDRQKLLNIFVSLDTPVCSASVHTFNEKVSESRDLVVLNISMDLPFAASRFCRSENLDNVITLSAYDSTFPEDYGVKISSGPLKGLCARAVIMLDRDNHVLYRELVPEITLEPDYTAALKSF